ncbi:MAG: DUF5689 domain-containing protein [Tidjanibacter sp.]|nr:DUF5689 domain-containing protein [Tidjanibacter sp.]
MKKIIYLAFATALLTGCYEKWDEPAPLPLADDQTLIDDGYTLMTINDFKQQFFYKNTPEPAATIKAVKIPDAQKIYLKGKVISTDESGNLYRSLYIQDMTGYQGGAIELKIGTGSLYNTYKVGQILYVKTDGLVLGNYRWMLSLGGPSVDAKYSNGYVDIEGKIEQKFLRGNIVGLTSADTLVIKSANVANYIGTNDRKYLGCLTRFEGIQSKFGTVSDNGSFSSSDVFPSYLWSATVNGTDTYVNFLFSTPHYIASDSPYLASRSLPNTWAYSYPVKEQYSFVNNKVTINYPGIIGSYESFYGSALFLYSSAYPFIVRTSAYSKFALNEIPADGATVDMTAILTKYCSSGGGYTKYQLVLNSDKDVKIK